MSRHLGALILALAGALWIAAAVQAQGAIQATLSAPQTDAFPQISAHVEVFDELGRFISDLQPPDVTVLENEQRLPVDNLQELRPGVQFVVAINPGHPLAIRDPQGNSRYDFLLQALREWAAAQQTAGQDDLSVLATSGLEQTHLSDPAAWWAALEAFQPDLRSAVPSLDVLSRALTIAADSPPRPGMGRAVLFITPYPETNFTAASGSLADQARQASIQVHVWMVASPNLFDSPGARELSMLASGTGGQFFAYSGAEPFPDLEGWLEPARRVYSLNYTSMVRASGPNQVSIEIKGDGFETTSAPQTFDLQITPPNPVFVSPPAQIVRSEPATAQGDQGALLPDTQTLEILVEFPDGHHRGLRRTSLYVDGQVVAENRAPPFERFTWDLSAYTTSSRVLLHVEAVDSLGLTGLSIDTPLQITVQQPATTLLRAVSRNAPVLAGAAVLMAGAVLLLVLILGGRIHPRPLYAPRRRRRPPEDPVTQPVSIRSSTPTVPSRRRGAPPARPPQRSSQAPAPPLAYLVWFTDNEQPATAAPIPITLPEVTFGTDQERASVVLEDPSVEGLHARLRLGPDGAFQLLDLDSIAGTWINYAPLAQEWAGLQDGDLIHIGRVGFRFASSDPQIARRPKIIYRKSGS